MKITIKSLSWGINVVCPIEPCSKRFLITTIVNLSRFFTTSAKMVQRIFMKKTIHIGRHFSDKGRMRKLIVEFNEVDALPQK